MQKDQQPKTETKATKKPSKAQHHKEIDQLAKDTSVNQ